MPKPIVKWVGGKTQLLTEIQNRMPKKFNNYFEPFLGGGAVTFGIQPQNMHLSDLNNELINLYDCVKNNYEIIIDYIEKFKIIYNKNPEIFYYDLREFNVNDFDNNDKYFLAARTLFLNKTCFNGLYRLNSKEKFNVPWNHKEKSPNVYDLENLKEVSKILKSVKWIKNISFLEIESFLKKGDFIYIDPPYDLIKKTTFDGYLKNSFGKEGQEKLADFCKRINEKGVFFLLSNHNTDFIQNIYSSFNLDIVHANRMVNSKASGRGKVEEVLIYNYDFI